MVNAHGGVLGAALLGVMACGGAGETVEDRATPPAVELTVAAVGDGAAGGAVTLRLAAHGIAIRPAGTDEPNSGHHHLFVDRDITPAGETIPAEDGIIHLGGGQTEYELTLDAGAHTIIAVLGDHAHVRLAAVKTDTVSVVSRP